MARQKSPSPHEPKKNPSLVVPRSEAAEKIKAQIDKGYELKTRNIVSVSGLEQAIDDKTKWKTYTNELLSRQFDDPSIATDFMISDRASMYFMDTSFSEKVQMFEKNMGKTISNLESLYERLELIPELNPLVNTTVKAPVQNVAALNKVFIVHGHDNAAKQSAARFIEKLGLEAIIFHEQEDLGDTIIEKLDRVSNVGYAIILLTPDDLGHAKNTPEKAQHRARQNVIFEWGYFISKLGRKNVFALLKDDVEMLSDLQGVLYTKMDEEEAWKFKLAKEMRAAGFDIDLNKII